MGLGDGFENGGICICEDFGLGCSWGEGRDVGDWDGIDGELGMVYVLYLCFLGFRSFKLGGIVWESI